LNKLSDTIGKICEALLPIPEEFYIGNSDSSICVCTLSSIKLLKEIKNSEIIDKIAIVGRLFTENKGIDSMIKHVNENKKIKTIIVCGKKFGVINLDIHYLNYIKMELIMIRE